MPGRGTYTSIFMAKWIGCRRLGNTACYILYIYVKGNVYQRQLSMHGIRPQGHLYVQVTLLSYDTVYVSIQLLLMHRLQFYT